MKLQLTKTYTANHIALFKFYMTKKYLVYLMIFVAAIMTWVTFSMNPDESWYTQWGLVAWYVLGTPILTLGLMWGLTILTYKRSLFFEHPIDIIFDDLGITQTMNGKTAVLKWEDIVTIQERKYAFFFYLTKQQVLYVPKSFLNSDELQTLRDMIHQKWKLGVQEKGKL